MHKVHVLAGFDMVVYDSNDTVSNELTTHGFFEVSYAQQMVATTGRSIPMDGIFLDIGANIGYYSLLFAKAGFQVIAVEPKTRNREALAATLCLNPDLRKRVAVMPVALVAPEDTGMFCVMRPFHLQNIGNAHLKCGREPQVHRCAAAEPYCEEVPVKTLDTLLAEQNPLAISAAKFDVEAYECNIFRGGQTLFQKYHPHFLKVETRWNTTSDCVAAEARKHHYQLFPIDNGNDTLMVSSSSSPRFLLFLFFFPFSF